MNIQRNDPQFAKSPPGSPIGATVSLPVRVDIGAYSTEKARQILQKLEHYPEVQEAAAIACLYQSWGNGRLPLDSIVRMIEFIDYFGFKKLDNPLEVIDIISLSFLLVSNRIGLKGVKTLDSAFSKAAPVQERTLRVDRNEDSYQFQYTLGGWLESDWLLVSFSSRHGIAYFPLEIVAQAYAEDGSYRWSKFATLQTPSEWCGQTPRRWTSLKTWLKSSADRLQIPQETEENNG